MKLDADPAIVYFFFEKVEKILQEKKRSVAHHSAYMQGWRAAEEYHRELQRKGITTEQDAINRHLRLS